ncbi:MAG: hypothetical protein E7463_03355 [Ruminococcaceae bacterium]|nr:hypothetical protein [Oscillospiraceae bacterium]
MSVSHIDVDPIVGKVRRIVASHRLAEGDYCRWLWQDEKSTRELGTNEYGCADAANLLYTIGDFVQDPDSRAAWISKLQSMQNPETGMFVEATHHTIHTTAHCLAALELFDARPLYPLTDLLPYLDHQAFTAFLDALPWETGPWNASHQGAGLFASLVITRDADRAWQDAYFTWLRERACSTSGLGLEGRQGSIRLVQQLGGWFHYMFNHEYAREPFPYPEKIIDTCIDLYRNQQLSPLMGRQISFMEIDWVFLLNRSSRQTPHRFHEVKETLWDFAQSYLPWLASLDEQIHDALNDLHMLFGAVCAVAELQLALPGKVRTEVPLKLVLDRRPFI